MLPTHETQASDLQVAASDHCNEFILFSSSLLERISIPAEQKCLYSYDDEFFVRNLECSVDKASNGASHLGTTNVCLFPFSSDRVSYEILSMHLLSFQCKFSRTMR